MYVLGANETGYRTCFCLGVLCPCIGSLAWSINANLYQCAGGSANIYIYIYIYMYIYISLVPFNSNRFSVSIIFAPWIVLGPGQLDADFLSQLGWCLAYKSWHETWWATELGSMYGLTMHNWRYFSFESDQSVGQLFYLFTESKLELSSTCAVSYLVRPLGFQFNATWRELRSDNFDFHTWCNCSPTNQVMPTWSNQAQTSRLHEGDSLRREAELFH